MSDIKFYCHSCGQKLGIDTKAVGMLIRCTKCNAELVVPRESEIEKTTSSTTQPIPELHLPERPAHVKEQGTPVVSPSPDTVRQSEKAQMEKAWADEKKILNDQIALLNTKMSSLHDEVKEFENKASEAITKQGVSSEENARLKSENAGLLKSRQEVAELTRSMTEMKQQLADMREKEEELLKKIEANKAPAPKKNDPPGDPVSSSENRWSAKKPRPDVLRLNYFVAGLMVMSIVAGIGYLWLWPLFETDHAPPVPVVARQTSSPVVSMDDPVVIDDVEITVRKVSVSHVNMMSLTDKEFTSPDKYLVVHVHLVNKNQAREIMLYQTWNNARMHDEKFNRFPIAFTDQGMLDTVKDMVRYHDLKPGGEVDDIILFKWVDFDSSTYTLIVNPVFRMKTGGDSTVILSSKGFSMTIPDDRVEKVSEQVVPDP